MKPLGFSSMPWGFILGLKLLCMLTRTHTHWKAHRQHYPSQVFNHATSLLNSKHGIKPLSPLSILSFKPRNKTKQFCHLSICVICILSGHCLFTPSFSFKCIYQASNLPHFSSLHISSIRVYVVDVLWCLSEASLK